MIAQTAARLSTLVHFISASNNTVPQYTSLQGSHPIMSTDSSEQFVLKLKNNLVKVCQACM